MAFLTASAVSAQAQACVPVDGDQIRMRDLALVDARFRDADPEVRVGLAPQTGAQRVFWPSELMQIAKRNGIAEAEPFAKACFERRTRMVSSDELRAAIRAWAPAAAQIVVVEQSRFAAPIGELVIPRPALPHAGADGTVLLHGFVRFDGDHRFPVWARIRFSLTQKVVVAIDSIPAGAEIDDTKIKIEGCTGGIEAMEFASDLARVAGRVTRRRIAAGDPVATAALEEPKQVKSGTVVAVEVKNGATRLSLDGRAESSGRVGETVTIRNPASGKSFPARVTGENSVAVFLRGANVDERSAN